MRRRLFLRAVAGAAAAIGIPFPKEVPFTNIFQGKHSDLLIVVDEYPIGAGGFLIPEETAKDLLVLLGDNTSALNQMSEVFERRVFDAYTKA